MNASSHATRANNANVYILGAGFSVDAGLPAIADFLNQMRDSADWLTEHSRKTELDAVNAVLDFRHKAAAAGYRVNIDLDNIEDLFSLAAALPEESISRAIQVAIGATLHFSHEHSHPPIGRMRVSKARQWPTPDAWRAVARVIPNTPYDTEDFECSVYDYYASVLSGRTSVTEGHKQNVVITFNYDLLLEQALERLAIPYSYGLDQPQVKYGPSARCCTETSDDTLLLIKLHGSLNWGLRSDGVLELFGSYDDTLKVCKHPHVVPPTWEKGAVGPTRMVWERALGALSNATRLVIAGLSFRSTDAHFKYLLAAGLMDNSALRQIVVVNPEATRLKDHIYAILRAAQFEYGVVRLHDASIRQFLNNPQALTSIGRPMTHPGLDLIDLTGQPLTKQHFLRR